MERWLLAAVAAGISGGYGRGRSHRRGYAQLHRTRPATGDCGASGAAVLADGWMTRMQHGAEATMPRSLQAGLT
jgi:hypothetical protein